MVASQMWLEETEFSNKYFGVPAAPAKKVKFQHPFVFLENYIALNFYTLSL